MLPTLEKDVVSLSVVGSPLVDALLIVLGQFHCKGLDDVARDSVLQAEDVLQVAVVAIRPYVATARGVDELRVDANVGAAFAHAAFQDITNAERLRDLSHVVRFAFVRERGIAGDDEQSRHLGQIGDEVLGDPIGEIRLFGIAAHVVERQDGDRGFAGGRECGWG